MTRKLSVFNSVSVDGYFTDSHGDMTFAKNPIEDAEFDAFVAGNASGDSVLLFGRITYQMMSSFWPTPMAAKMMPEVAKGMNESKKIVFSRTLKQASWNNTTLLKGDAVEEVRALKRQQGPSLVILGSGTIVAQLTAAGLIDEYQVMIVPVVLGAGRTMFEGVSDRLTLKRTNTRSFANGNVFNTYET